MQDYEHHTAFLVALINHQTPGACNTLEGEFTQAIARERCIRRAVFAVSVVGGLSVAGIGYAAVLSPNFFQNTAPFVVRLFHATGLASAICLAGFLPLWGYTRAQLRNLHRQCRQAIMGCLLDTRVSHSYIVQKSGPVSDHDTNFMAPTS